MKRRAFVRPPLRPTWLVRRVNDHWVYGPIAVGVKADPVTGRRWLRNLDFQTAITDADRRARAQCPPKK